MLAVAPVHHRLPPSELSDAQAMVWRDVVSTLPGDYIGAWRLSFALWWLTAASVCRGRLLELQLRRFEVEWMNVEGWAGTL